MIVEQVEEEDEPDRDHDELDHHVDDHDRAIRRARRGEGVTKTLDKARQATIASDSTTRGTPWPRPGTKVAR